MKHKLFGKLEMISRQGQQCNTTTICCHNRRHLNYCKLSCNTCYSQYTYAV